MATSVISILSDSSEDSVDSHVPIVPADPLVTSEVGVVYVTSPAGVLDLVDYSSSDSDPSEDSLPLAPELPLVSPFLCSDDSEADSESDPAKQRLERHESLTVYDAMVSRWKDRVASRPSLPSGSSYHDTLAPSSELPLALVVKEYQEKDKIKSKPNKNRKRGKAKKSHKQLQSSSKLSRDQTSNPTASTNPTLKEAIVVPSILAEQFELKHSLINMMTSEQFFGLEKDNPHDHIRAARRWLEKEPPRSITTWNDLVSKFINEFFPPSRTVNLRNEILNFQQKFDESFHEAWERYKDLIRACPYHGFTELHQLDTFYNALSPADQNSLNATGGGNLLEKSPQDALTIIENKSKVRNSRSKPIASPVNTGDNHSSFEIAKLTHAFNQQTSAVTTAMMAMLKQLQSNLPSAQVKAAEEICVTCGGAHPYYQCLAAGGNTFPEFMDNIKGYVSAAAGNYNQGNPDYRPQGVANQMRPPGFAQPNV
nr:hypothetical protein [Tanacetum cinerariifolium]